MSTLVATPLGIAATVTTASALLAGKHTPVDATAAAVTVTLPAAAAGAHLSVEKYDTGVNAVTVSGSIRGSASTLLLSLTHESVEFVADTAGSWWPIAGHKTLSSLDARADTVMAGFLNNAASASRVSLNTAVAGKADIAKLDNGGMYLKPIRVPTLVVDQTWPNREYDFVPCWVDPDGITMYAQGFDGQFYKSVDSGATWVGRAYKSVLTPTTFGFLKTNLGTLLTWASAYPTTMYRSVDDGATWALVHTMTAVSQAHPMGVTGWCIDPVTNYIYAGEYQSIDTGIMTVTLWRSVNDGATWQAFHIFPCQGDTTNPLKVRHIHAIQWDPVQARIVVMVGDSDPNAGMYRVNAAGTDLEPMLLNSQITNIAGLSEGARAIAIMPFTDYLVWTGDATGNPYLMRVLRSELAKPFPAVERIYRVNSTAWFAQRASIDGSRWVFSSCNESVPTALDTAIHLYAVEDQGATVYEIASLSGDVANQTTALAPLSQPLGNISDVFWMKTHNMVAGVWKCRLARGGGQALTKPLRKPLVYAWQTVNTNGSVTVPASGELIVARDITSAYVKKLHIFNAGVMDDTGATTKLKLRVRKKVGGTVLFECIFGSQRYLSNIATSVPVASITTLVSADVVEFVVVNVDTVNPQSGSAFVTYGWGY